VVETRVARLPATVPVCDLPGNGGVESADEKCA
jgi:hypothetical protein